MSSTLFGTFLRLLCREGTKGPRGSLSCGFMMPRQPEFPEKRALHRGAPACRGFLSSQHTWTRRLVLLPSLWEEPGEGAGGRVLISHRARHGLCFQWPMWKTRVIQGAAGRSQKRTASVSEPGSRSLPSQPCERLRRPSYTRAGFLIHRNYEIINDVLNQFGDYLSYSSR